jgi:hypothetical protein
MMEDATYGGNPNCKFFQYFKKEDLKGKAVRLGHNSTIMRSLLLKSNSISKSQENTKNKPKNLCFALGFSLGFEFGFCALHKSIFL